MSDFYSEWLERSKNNEKVVNDAPRVMRSKDLKWVRTRQDHKAALMIAPELGFPTGGSCLMRAEIPVGWHTGKHLHGEEAIYVESGEGFMVLDDKRYDFFPGTSPSHSHTGHRTSCSILETSLSAICRAWPGIWRPMFTWERWNSLKIVARTTRRFYLLSRRKSPSIGRKTGGGSPCIRNSMRNPTSRSMGRPIF